MNFGENLRRLRQSKKYTQEYVADKLNVSAQAVSRWECSTTFPDILLLPEIARLYCVTVDDLYKKHSVAYDNYAQRLSSVYEKTRDPEDLMRCMIEYKKLMKSGELSMVDKWNYATIHHFMMRSCIDIAMEWYDRAIEDGYENDIHIYTRARSLRAHLMNEIGKIDIVINEQKKRCEQLTNDQIEMEFLVEAYIIANDFENALDVYKKAVKRFPESWRLYIYGGEIYEHMQRYEDAFKCWDKAGEIGTYFYDEYYCKACCYNDIGEYSKAFEIYMEISEMLRKDGYDVEADMAIGFAEEAKAKIK